MQKRKPILAKASAVLLAIAFVAPVFYRSYVQGRAAYLPQVQANTMAGHFDTASPLRSQPFGTGFSPASQDFLQSNPPESNLPSAALPATVVSKGKDGFTTWSVDWGSQSWCVPVSSIRYPFDLHGQDPTWLSEASLQLTFDEGPTHIIQGPNPGDKPYPVWEDASWGVGLNSAPPDEWHIIDSIEALPSEHKSWTVSQPIEVDTDDLIDGENNVWLQQHDSCPSEPGCSTCACTCINLSKVVLRAAVDLEIDKVSPEPDTRSVWFDQRTDSEIRVKFTTVVSNTSVTKDTFQLYYYDDNEEKVMVDGAVKRISGVEYAFTPKNPLLDGVRYIAQVWGQQDAQAEGLTEWVEDVNSGALEQGALWDFWTIPQLQVKIVPIQVLEGMALVQDKPTVLRTFIRWDTKPGVFTKSQAPKVEVDDVTVTWVSDNDTGNANWSDPAGGWKPVLNAKTSQRKREYQVYTNAEESYTNREKWISSDSVNYYGFTPRSTGSYLFTARVLVKDSRGTYHPFRGQTTLNSSSAKEFGLNMKAVAVGADYGKTGTVDLSTVINDNLNGMKYIYPLSSISSPPAPSAMDYYSPTTSLSLFSWTTEPAWSFTKKYLLEELSTLCLRTTGCRAMVGLVRPVWLADQGTTLPEAAPYGALIKTDNVSEANYFVMAHEIGHLARFEHIDEPAGEGYNVYTQTDKRYSVDKDVFDFMYIDPVQSGARQLWISPMHYVILGTWTGATTLQTDGSPSADSAGGVTVQSTDPLLLVSGAISETTGTVSLLPWYQMDPGQYLTPEPGPYSLVFLDGAGQPMVNYTRAFTVSTTLQPAGNEPEVTNGLAFFSFITPYPAAMAKVQVRRSADNKLLKEIIAAPGAPVLNIQSPGSGAWHGPQSIAWTTDAGTRFFAVDISTDNGATWKALAVNLSTKSFTIQTTSLSNTTQARVRVSASDGLRTTNKTAGPFSIANPPLVGYVSPSSGAAGVGIDSILEAGFRDDMDAASLTGGSFTLTGGPYGAVPGTVTYNPGTKRATFTPKAALAYATSYTANLTTGIKDIHGTPLPAAKTWTFTTQANLMPPEPLGFMPINGAMDVPLNTRLVVAWDQALNPDTLTPISYTLATAQGILVSGGVSYDDAAHTAVFTPSGSLAPHTIYIATLKSGIQSALGNPTQGDYHWSFTTGTQIDNSFNFTHAFFDTGVDNTGDGLYDLLVVQVGVQVTTTNVYSLSATLADANGAEITQASGGGALQPGSQFLSLSFDGNRIGGHGLDGPFTLTRLVLYQMDVVSGRLLSSVTGQERYTTFAYRATQFPAPLRFNGIPDLLLIPGSALTTAFNVHDYAHHTQVSSDKLSYTILSNSDLRAGVTLAANGALSVNPQAGWQGTSRVTLQASHQEDAAQTSFQITVGWKAVLDVPVVLKNSSASSAQTRSNWHIAFSDNFENGFTNWRLWSSISNPPWGPGGWYHWGITNCSAFSGLNSASPFKGGDDGLLTTCGTPYPNTLVSTMRYGPSINLKYTSQAIFSAKVWSDLDTGDQICAMVTTEDMPDLYINIAHYYGVCRSGKTNGWEDFKLDLAQVPTLGNVLGLEKVYVAFTFIANDTGSRPGGVYIDDAQLRVCPQGLTCQP